MSDSNSVVASPSKKIRCDNSVPDSVTGEIEEEFLPSSFGSFQITQILSKYDDSKSVAVEGTFKNKLGRAVIHLQKLPFEEKVLKEVLSFKTTLQTIFKNDIYYNQLASVPAYLNEVKSTLIYPAEEKHIQKYLSYKSSLIEETWEMYENVALPHMQSSSSFSNKWIYNILDHEKEVDRIVYEDSDKNNGFILLPDLNWTGEQVENLHLQAIVHKRDLLCLRSLKKEHIPLLKNIYNNGSKAIYEKYGVPLNKLRIYIHYQPSYYHLHVHFSALSHVVAGVYIGKAHFLLSVINSLELCEDYYQKVGLSFTIKDNHPLKIKYDSYKN